LQVAGVDLEGLLRQVRGDDGRRDEKRPLVDFNSGADRIQVFVEGAGL
jgi:hypothetical protein